MKVGELLITNTTQLGKMMSNSARVTVTALTQSCSTHSISDGAGDFGCAAPVFAGKHCIVKHHFRVSMCSDKSFPVCEQSNNAELIDNGGDSVVVGSDISTERVTLQSMVAGDGEGVCTEGIMRRGVMYGSEQHDAPASAYWPMHIDGEIMSGAPSVAFKLSARYVRGMRSTERGEDELIVPAQRSSRKTTVTERGTFAARFIVAWCRKHPGMAVCLRRLGAGSMLAPYELSVHGETDVSAGVREDLDCLKAAFVDAVRVVRGRKAAMKVIGVMDGGTTWSVSLNGLTPLLAESGVNVSIRRVPKEAVQAIRSRDSWVAFNWFGECVRKGVFLLQLEGHGIQPDVVTVDAKARYVYDKAQPVVL